jgi:hypothetical protein
MTIYVLFYNKESGDGEIGQFTDAGMYQPVSTGQFLSGKDGWDIVQSTFDVVRSDGSRSRNLAYYKQSNGRLDVGGLDFSKNPPVHATTSNCTIESGWDFIFPFEQVDPFVHCELYINKNGKGLVVDKRNFPGLVDKKNYDELVDKKIIRLFNLPFSPWSHVVEVGQRFFFYNQKNGHTALGNIVGQEGSPQDPFGYKTFTVTGFVSHELTPLPASYQIAVTTDHYMLLYNSQTGTYSVGAIESDQWQPVKSSWEIFSGSPAKEKTTEAGYTHVTHLTNDDLLFYNAKSGKALVAAISRKFFFDATEQFPPQFNPAAGLLQMKRVYEPPKFSQNWTNIVSFQVDIDIIG